jgi:hypothetical protein
MDEWSVSYGSHAAVSRALDQLYTRSLSTSVLEATRLRRVSQIELAEASGPCKCRHSIRLRECQEVADRRLLTRELRRHGAAP